MPRYPSSTPRAAIGLVAIALTLVTMTAAVILPAVAETARANGVMPAAVTMASTGTPGHTVELQCPPQG